MSANDDTVPCEKSEKGANASTSLGADHDFMLEVFRKRREASSQTSTESPDFHEIQDKLSQMA